MPDLTDAGKFVRARMTERDDKRSPDDPVRQSKFNPCCKEHTPGNVCVLPYGHPEESDSLFDNFGGYYAVSIDGVEMARFAPSYFWTDFALVMRNVEGFSYKWVPNE